jgi:hypothetical protein
MGDAIKRKQTSKNQEDFKKNKVILEQGPLLRNLCSPFPQQMWKYSGHRKLPLVKHHRGDCCMQKSWMDAGMNA